MHPDIVSDTWIFIITLVSWSHGPKGSGEADGYLQPPKAQVEVGCQNQVISLAWESHLAKDLAFELHFHLSEILPLFPRSLLALRNHSCWSCLVPPTRTIQQQGYLDDKVLRASPFSRVSLGLTSRLLVSFSTILCPVNIALFLFRRLKRNKSKRKKKTKNPALLQAQNPLLCLYPGRWR